MLLRQHLALALGAGALLALAYWRREPEPSVETSRAIPAPSASAALEPDDPPGVLGVSAFLRELTDLPRLAAVADPPYTAHLASSYDRRSKGPGEPDWFANDDWASAERPNYVRKEQRNGRDEYVLLEAKGPGVLTRIWTATPTGTLRIYLDGEAAPALAEPMTALLSGHGPFPEPFAYVAADGYDAYFPIPYRRSIKVTIDELIASTRTGNPLPKFYYHLTYRTYDSSVAERFRTFRQGDIARARPTLARVAGELEAPNGLVPAGPGFERRALMREGDALVARVERDAGGALRELWFLVRDPSDAVLAQATLVLEFDDRPPLRVPFGEFFGGAPGFVPLESLALSVTQDGTYSCRFAMPFARSATLRVESAAGIEGSLLVETRPFDARSLYFGVVRRGEKGRATQPPSDLALAELSGPGTYVGTELNIENPPGAKWWGEGDEKIYVDGEPFPSFFGTGTEDYFGYAWSATVPFQRAFHAQPRVDGPGFSGHISNLRLHVLDAIPFTRSLRFDLELWHWDATRVAWSSLAYFYSR